MPPPPSPSAVRQRCLHHGRTAVLADTSYRFKTAARPLTKTPHAHGILTLDRASDFQTARFVRRLRRRAQPLSRVEIDPRELLHFISAGWSPMNEMCERAEFSERAIYDRSKAIMEYYHLPFDAPPPR